MKFWRSIMKQPQPEKGCLIAYLIVFGVVFVSVAATVSSGQGRLNPVMPWGMGALGLTAVVLGLVLASDLRGSARAYASLVKDYKPMGVDYSKSFLANAKFARISGVMFVLVGIWFIVGSTIMASQMA